MKTNELIDILRDESNPNVLDYVDEAADTIEAQQKRIEELEAERRWIPVTERRPTDADTDDKRGYGCVEVYSPSSGVDVASVDWVNDFVNDVTHWRPLPQPPKEGV